MGHSEHESSVPPDDREAGDEPRTMARAQAMVEAMWPRKPFNVWISNRGALRHVAIRFARGVWIEGSAMTWLAAFRQIDAQVDEIRKGKR